MAVDELSRVMRLLLGVEEMVVVDVAVSLLLISASVQSFIVVVMVEELLLW